MDKEVDDNDAWEDMARIECEPPEYREICSSCR